jgi:hypothetical protein
MHVTVTHAHEASCDCWDAAHSFLHPSSAPPTLPCTEILLDVSVAAAPHMQLHWLYHPWLAPSQGSLRGLVRGQPAAPLRM